MLAGRLNTNNYLVFLQNVLPGLLENIALQVRREMWSQHDRAPAVYEAQVRAHLDAAFPGHWIGRGGPVARPPRSPDLNLLEFFPWGHLEALVYQGSAPHIAEELIARIVAAAGDVRKQSQGNR
nr:unnamed protein product [Callosobruchus chinensis]